MPPLTVVGRIALACLVGALSASCSSGFEVPVGCLDDLDCPSGTVCLALACTDPDALSDTDFDSEADPETDSESDTERDTERDPESDPESDTPNDVDGDPDATVPPDADGDTPDEDVTPSGLCSSECMARPDATCCTSCDCAPDSCLPVCPSTDDAPWDCELQCCFDYDLLECVAGCSGGAPEPEASYFCAFSTNVARDRPFFANVTWFVGDQISMEFQPLVRDFDEDGSTPMERARQPVGSTWGSSGVPLDDEGCFEEMYLELIGLPGLANPLTYRPLDADFFISGCFVTDDVVHGGLGGAVTNPTTVPLNGSTWACVRTDDPGSIDPVFYDELVSDCR